jgi:segregation and condensation protein A
VLELEGEAYDIEEKIARIQSRVLVAGRLSFETLLAECRSRLEMIVTFLALLELLKLNRLVAVQSATFGEIELVPPGETEAFDDGGPAAPAHSEDGGADGRA